jgi:uncharacterized alkaline shock family protein YloU
VTDEVVLTERAGTITVPSATLSRIVATAAERVDGARVRRPRRSVTVDVTDGSATVALQLVARFGVVLPHLAEAVQREVAAALEQMCELDVAAVDVAIEELV